MDRKSPPVGRTLLTVGVMLIATNLRPGVVSVSPELDAIRTGTGLPATAAGLLTTLPILCFGALAPFAPRLARRIGARGALGAMMLLLTAGIAVRTAPGTVPLFVGTVLVGAAIALSNVLVPALIKRDFHDRAGLMTGVYSVALFTGAALAAGVTVPLGGGLGLSWRGTLGMWAVWSALAFAVWLPQLRGARADRPAAATSAAPGAAREADGPSLWRSRLAWQITFLMGLQSLEYYAAAAWIPTLLTDDGMARAEAGWMLSLSSLAGITGSLLLTVLIGRARSQVGFALAGSALFAVSFAGLMAAPTAGAYVWMIAMGLGSGLLIGAALAVVVLRAPDGVRAAEMSGMAQCVGYLLAAVGPFALGWLRDATGGWTVPMLGLLVLTVPMALAGIAAGRDRTLPPRTSRCENDGESQIPRGESVPGHRPPLDTLER
ncbi:hypothetical protein BIV57_11745 [Mangrovactinospora gilvigrisea]|uniref:Major facilitator superfamily (MFS) profile domain-containing protein n=1 Tax=Mangrovactinospora gilvigrisea TaxID=1428644 RepID=A0A1J7CCA7_9ACTN|nr:MFS transporter [Mangrovactinospora gilvigrisea]OIV37314.1 hypothetical protein BIV57_11745 [Mangrovactinospora gilvigrisea]